MSAETEIKNFLHVKNNVNLGKKAIGFMIDEDDFVNNNRSQNIQELKDLIKNVIEENGSSFNGIALQDQIDVFRVWIQKETKELKEKEEKVKNKILNDYSEGIMTAKEVSDSLLFIDDIDFIILAKLISFSKNEDDVKIFFNEINNYIVEEPYLKLLIEISKNNELSIDIFLNENKNVVIKELSNLIQKDHNGIYNVVNKLILNKDVDVENIIYLINENAINYKEIMENAFLDNYNIVNKIQNKVEKRLNEDNGVSYFLNFIKEIGVIDLIDDENMKKLKNNLILLSMETTEEDAVLNFVTTLDFKKENLTKVSKENNIMLYNLEKIEALEKITKEIAIMNMTSDYYQYGYDDSSVMPEKNVTISQMLSFSEKIFNEKENEEIQYNILINMINEKTSEQAKKIKEISNDITDFLNFINKEEDIKKIGLHELIMKLDHIGIEDFTLYNSVISKLNDPQEFNYFVEGLNGALHGNLNNAIIMNLIQNDKIYEERKKNGYLDLKSKDMFEKLLKDVGDNIFNYCNDFDINGAIILDNQDVYSKVKSKNELPKEFNDTYKKHVIHNLIISSLNQELNKSKESNERQYKIFKIIKDLKKPEYEEMLLKIRDNLIENELSNDNYIKKFNSEILSTQKRKNIMDKNKM